MEVKNLKEKINKVFPTQGAMARATGVHESVLSKILNGLREPTPAQRKAIDEALLSATNGIEKVRADILGRRACRGASEFAVGLLLLGIYDRLGDLLSLAKVDSRSADIVSSEIKKDEM